MLVFAQWLETTPISVTIKSVHWIVPLVQSIHILTIGAVFSSVLMIALRVLGVLRLDQEFSQVMARFSPWIGRGMIVLLLTGLTLVVGEPVRELMSLSFWLKMGLIVVGVLSAAMFARSLGDHVAEGRTEPDFPARTKVAALATLVLWLTIIFLGRAIAYDVEVWGSLSLSPRA